MDVSMMGRQQVPLYNFPKLPNHEIIKCLHELRIPITKEIILKPEEYKEDVRRLLESLTELCTGRSRDEWNQPAFAGLNAFSYPELHDESIPHFNALRAIAYMMNLCDIKDFSIRDIFHPTANRLNRQLSGIINFCKFREERLILLSDLNSTQGEYLDALSQSQERHEVLNNRLNLLRNQTREEGDQVQQLELENKELMAKYAELKRLAEQLDGQIEVSREQLNKVSTRTDDAKENLLSLQQEQSRLQGQVVTSPEKFRKQIIEVGQTLQHEQKDAKTADKKLRELTSWLANIDEAADDVNGALDTIQEIRGEVERQKALIADMTVTKSMLASLSGNLSEMHQSNQQVERQAHRAEEKLASLRRQAGQRSDENQAHVANLHSQILEAETFRVQVKARAERMENESKRLEKEVEAESLVMDQGLADLEQTYDRMERKVVRHLQGLQKVLESTMANDASATNV